MPFVQIFLITTQGATPPPRLPHLEFEKGFPSSRRTCRQSYLPASSKQGILFESFSVRLSCYTTWLFGSCMRFRGSYSCPEARLVGRVRPTNSLNLGISQRVAFWGKAHPPQPESWLWCHRLGCTVSPVSRLGACSGTPITLLQLFSPSCRAISLSH